MKKHQVFKRALACLMVVFILMTSVPLNNLTSFSEGILFEASAEDDKASNKRITDYNVGEIVEFGWYPQTLETDSRIIEALNNNHKHWDSFQYYSGTGNFADGKMIPSENMLFSDIDLDGDGFLDYRAVIIEKYRPTNTNSGTTADRSNQDDNGYYINNTYYFKYEPIGWRILNPSIGLMMSESIIDSQAYNDYLVYRFNDSSYYGDPNFSYYASDYNHSSLLTWLKGTFKETAFTKSQKNTIQSISILSYYDTIESNYGFQTNASYADENRIAKGTDYAKCQGLATSNSTSCWWLSNGSQTYQAHSVGVDGKSYFYDNIFDVNTTSIGVRPVIQLSSLSKENDKISTDYYCKKVTAKAPTCFEDGWGEYEYCTKCSYSTKVTIPASGHNIMTFEGKSPTCTEVGWNEYEKCSKCDYSTYLEISAYGHSLSVPIIENSVVPTCTNGGNYDEVISCLVCGIETSRVHKVVNALGHDFSDYISNNDATCTENGTKTAKCKRCELTNTIEDINSKGHQYNIYRLVEASINGYVTIQGEYICEECGIIGQTTGSLEKAIIKEATCTEYGKVKKTYTFIIDGKTYKKESFVSVEKKSHTFTNGVLHQPTCEKGMYLTKTCEVCGITIDENSLTPALGHDYSIVEGTAKVPTCVTDGKEVDKICSRCKKVVTGSSIPATDHVSNKGTVTKNPTCSATGTKVYKCTACGATVKTETLGKIAHTYTDKVTSATTAKDGKIVTACTICRKISKTVVIPKIASISLSPTSYTYDGKMKTPTVTVKNSKGTTLKSGTDYTVTYASGRKTPGQYAVKITFKGNYSGSKTLYFTILPGVTSKIATATNSSAVKIAWKAVPGATGYRVYQYDAKSKKYVTLKTTTSTSYTVTKLKSGTSYKFAVKAYSTVNGKVFWASDYKTVTATTNPGTPTLKVTAGTKKAALSWTKQTGATGYVVYMATSKNGKYSRIATLKGNSKVSYTKTGLTKGKIYYFKVAAYTVANGKTLYSSFSSVKAVKIK